MSTTQQVGVEATDTEVLRRAQEAIEELSRRGADVSRELVTVYERERKLLGGVKKRDAEIIRLRARCKALEKEVAYLTDRYDNLSGTPLAKLQRSYWRLRKRVVGGGQKGDAK